MTVQSEEADVRKGFFGWAMGLDLWPALMAIAHATGIVSSAGGDVRINHSGARPDRFS